MREYITEIIKAINIKIQKNYFNEVIVITRNPEDIKTLNKLEHSNVSFYSSMKYPPLRKKTLYILCGAFSPKNYIEGLSNSDSICIDLDDSIMYDWQREQVINLIYKWANKII